MQNATVQVQSPAQNLASLRALWDELADVPVTSSEQGGEPDCLEQPFLHFGAGTHREEVWRWFERQNSAFVVGDVQQNRRALI